VRASDADIAALRALFADHERDPAAHLHEYSQANMEFHKAIIRLGGVALMVELTDTLFIHMRAVRAVTMTQDDRARRGMADHLAIIDALAARDADRAAALVREHTLRLAAHIEAHAGLPEAAPRP
jgi:DNA-binding GntR family transcriptional regulator